MTREELYALKNVDIKSAKLDDLVDIQNIKVDSSKSVEERIVDFIEQIKNPYLFKVDDIIVKVNFNEEGSTFQECFQNFLKDSIKIM